jgi:FK506-binding nuclear protein
MFDPDSDEEEDYDLEPDADELEDSEDDSIPDGLDDLEDPRVTELDKDEEAPKLITAKKDKTVSNKNKRPASDSEDDDAEPGAETTLDELITKEAKAAKPAVNGEQKLSKKQLKKLKKNNGDAAAAPATDKVVEKKVVEVDVPPSSSSNKSDKKVSFAKELEQGPTPTKDTTTTKPTPQQKSTTPSLSVKTIQGVTLDDKKLGSGQSAKNGDRVSMRYIGKLKDTNKVFDSNKKGKPFSFKMGAGEVIKGWEIGVQGMQAGGERRITIPAALGYGSKKMPDIPPNSALVFDVKVLEVNKK